jgi:hypothetical protein
MVVELSDTPQIAWCGAHIGYCKVRTSPLSQMVPPDAFGMHLYGCNSLLKQCTIDPETNEEHCPLICVEPGWSPEIIPDDPNRY